MTSLSDRGYGILKTIGEDKIKTLKKKLTVTPFQPVKFGPRPIPFTLFVNSPSKIYVPRYFGLKEYGQPDTIKKNKLQESLSDKVIFKGKLRPIQLEAQKTFINEGKKYLNGGLVNLPCGYGKTILALSLITHSEIRKKTLILVHKEFLLHQWTERIKTFLPDAKIGVIQQKKVEIEGYDIVIGMLQSVAMKDYPPNTFSVFGFIIIDECHHLGAEVFSRALPKVCSSDTWLLGLSATPDRGDGLRCVFEWYLGPMLYQIEPKQTDEVIVEWWQYHHPDPEYQKVEYNMMDKVNTSKMITKLCDFQDRTSKIIEKIIQCYEEDRKILVLSDRRQHLDFLKNYFLERDYSIGCYIGGMTRVELELSENKKIILGTYSMASEGMDIPALNTVILATPKTNVKQAVGRIFRQQAHERTHIPLIIDLVDSHENFTRQSTHRKRLYKKNNYQFVYLNPDLSVNQSEHKSSCKEKSCNSKNNEGKELTIAFDKCMLDNSDSDNE